MTARAVGAVLALLAPLAARAYSAEEDASYLRAYKHCQEKRMIAQHRKEPIAPAEMALEHIGGREPRGLEFHAYLGCKDALMDEPPRSDSSASARFDAQRRAEPRDDWQTPKAWWLPGLGPYTWVFFADLLLGAGIGVISQRRRKSSAVVGALLGLVAGFLCFAPVFLFSIFFMFLSEPTSPMGMFLFTGGLILLIGLVRPGDSRLLPPF